MNSVFSVDDFSDPFWQAPPPPPTASVMNRSESEWALEKLLQEVSAAAPSVVSQSSSPSIPPENGEDDVVDVTKHPIRYHHQNPIPRMQPLDRNLTAPIDSEDYRALLKSKLDLACAAVALSMETNVAKPEDFSSSLPDDQRLAAIDVPLGAQSFGIGHGVSKAQTGADSGSLGIPASPAPKEKKEVQARQTTSGSSKEDTDDDDLEGDTGTNENTDPAAAKRVRRMQSNRESARRSRRRKQAQLSELETQVGQLRDERTSLLSRFTDINQKCDDAAVDHRILKADIETLRAKVKMAEEQVKRVTGLNPMFLARSNLPNPGMPFVGVDASTNVAVPTQPNPHQFFHQPAHGITSTAPHLRRLQNIPTNPLVPLAPNPQTDNGVSNIGGMTPGQLTASGQSMAVIPSKQQVQKHIGPTISPAGPLPVCDSGRPGMVANHKKNK